jgi:integrase
LKFVNFWLPNGTTKKDALVFDYEQKGLAVRVTASGGKSYLAQYTLASSKRHVALGSCSGLSLAAARDAVRTILGGVAKGRDPAADRKAAALDARRKAAHETLTLDALLDQWSALRLADKRQSCAAEAVRALRHAFDKRLALPAADLDRAAAVRVLDGLTKDGKPAMATRTAAYGRACFQWAIRRGALETNPFTNLPLTPVAKRERVLTDKELRSIWQATAGPGPYNAIVRMLMVTGQRREEVTGMTWDEIAPDLSAWSIAASRRRTASRTLCRCRRRRS